MDYEVGWFELVGWGEVGIGAGGWGGVKIISLLRCLRDKAVWVTSHINNATVPNFPGL